MSIQVVCVKCKYEQSVKNKVCKKCGEKLNKSKTFRITVKHNGETVKKIIHGNLELAKTIEMKIKTEMIEGKYFDRRKKAKESIKYSEFIAKKYLPDAKSKKSYERELSLLNLWILPVLGDKPINKISPFDIEKIKHNMMAKGLSNRSVLYAIAVVKHSLNRAIDWGILNSVNPATKVKTPKVNNRRVRFLSVEEANALLNEVKKRSQQTYEICLLSLHTGMRAGEIFNLKFQDLDFKNRLIYIRNPKNGEDRVSYMDDDVYEMLSVKDGKPDEYVFKTSTGKKIDSISRTFLRAVKRLGLNDGITSPKEKVVFHTLRHTFASWLAINGVSLYTIKELLGHKSITMTERYSHLSNETRRKAIETLSKVINSNVVQINNLVR